MLHQRVLDLDRRDPFAAYLEHVVGAPFVPVEAVLIHSVSVACRTTTAASRMTSFFARAPVKRRGARPFHEPIPGLACGHRSSVVIEKPQLIPGPGFAAGAGAVLSRGVRAEDVKHFGRAD